MKFHTLRVTFEMADGTKESFEVYMDLMLDEADYLSTYANLPQRPDDLSTNPYWRWLDGIDERNPDALRFLYWLGRKRSGNPYDGKFTAIDFWLNQVVVERVDGGDVLPDPDKPQPEESPDPTEGAETPSD